MTSQSGSGASGPSYGKQLAYVQIVAIFVVNDASEHTLITGLDAAFTPVSGARYVVEFSSPAVSEGSGSTVGELMCVQVLLDGDLICEGFTVNGIGGVGGSLTTRTRTLLGDGSAHTVSATVQNQSVGADGAIVGADSDSPAYIRVVQV